MRPIRLAMLVCMPAMIVAVPLGQATSATDGALIGLTETLPIDPRSGVALQGLDPITYFLPEGPQPGRARHEIVWHGAAWRFASAANRAAFQAGPERFLPRLGGHDPVALAQGRLAAGRPDLWAVVGGRLYLFHDPGSLERFLANPEGLAAAETAWPAARRTLVDPTAGRVVAD